MHIASTPKLDFMWFLPTSGDGSYLGTAKGQRKVDHRYLSQIAQAADRLGYHGVLLPTGRGCEDAWITAASVAPQTERLRFLVALRPGATLPAEAARQAVTFDRMSGGRLMLNVVTGGSPEDLAGDGIFLDHDERYAQSAEFLLIWRGLMAGETVRYEGRGCGIPRRWRRDGASRSPVILMRWSSKVRARASLYQTAWPLTRM